ncbi:MAG: hypothetical protein AAF251_11180 [Pseudomonadota bacterium]
MFETSKSILGPFCGDSREDDSWVIEDESDANEGANVPARSGDALRALAWSELTARLNAARELRRELRQEAILCAGASGATFGDAAASFFKTFGEGQRPVNPEALEGCKASSGNDFETSGVAAKGDARDDL